MIRVKSAIFLAVLLALIGCGAQLERPDERVLAPSKEEQEQRQRSVPTFTYRPGAGLMIEGRYLSVESTSVIEEQNDNTALIKVSAVRFSRVVVGLFCHVSQEFLTAEPPFVCDSPSWNAAFSRQSLDRFWIKLEESSNVVGCKDVMQATDFSGTGLVHAICD